MAETAFALFLADHLALISLLALAIAVVLTIWKDTNVGVMALGFALLVGYYFGGYAVKDLIKNGFPADLFLTLTGAGFLFGIAQVNGTLDKLTKYTVKSVKGNAAILPIVLFFLAFALASIGPGHIAVAALLAVPVMALAEEVGISPMLMALLVGNGAQAGAMSPIAPTGLIANKILAGMGVTGWGFTLWMNMLVTHIFVAAIAYVLFGGLKLMKNKSSSQAASLANIVIEPFDKAQKMTMFGVVILIIGVIGFKMDVGLGAFLIGSILVLLKAGDEKAALKVVPWGTIIMVTGVSVLVSLLNKYGGTKMFADLMGALSTPFTATLVVGFFAALLSAYASTSGVILPFFLPAAPALLVAVGAPPTDLLPLVSTLIVAGHLTDLSPLSTTGAVFIAQAGPKTDKRKLFTQMMAWGLSMSVFGAVISWLFFTVLRIP
jgi:di/tricarboxylate transporter